MSTHQDSFVTFLSHYGLWILFWGWILGIFGAIGDHYRGAKKELRRRRREKREHELAKLRLQGKLARRTPVVLDQLNEAVQDLKAGPCPHRPKNVKPVFSALGDHEAWLCTACDAQLPRDWAVLAEDL